MTFSSIANMWNEWNIRGIVILSLSLQVFLILCAPIRKKIVNNPIVFLLWLAYLIADWVAAFGIGLISHSQGTLFAHTTEVDITLQAFWASFLLLHLGGPDTITAFSLEDSSLWQRHLLNLIFQVNIAIYVFVQIFSRDKSLVIPTMLVFLAGVIKNVERTFALYLSSLSRLRESMLIQEKLSERELAWLVNELEDPQFKYSSEEEAKLTESIVVKHAYSFFHIFKVFLSDIFYSGAERHISCEYFHKVSAMDALRVISVELQFMYEVLHTKVSIMRSKWSYIFRFIAFTEVVMAFALFYRFKKHQLPKLDVVVTYILLFGGIALDVITLFMLVFSDWTVAEILHFETKSSKRDSFLARLKIKPYRFLHKLISAMDDLRKPRFATCSAKTNANATYEFLDTPFIFRRWSESISACHFSSEFWKESSTQMYKRDQCWGIFVFLYICSIPFHMVENIISCFHQTREIFFGRKLAALAMIPRYVFKKPFINKLWIFFFEEVKRKSMNAHNPTKVKEIFEARGDLFLRGILEKGGLEKGTLEELLQYVTKPTYDDSVISWHIATEIWYNKEKPTEKNDEREFSKVLSDYMLYLLLNQSHVTSAVAGFAQVSMVATVFAYWHIRLISRVVKDVEELYEGADVKPLNETVIKTDVLHQGIVLAKEIERLGNKKWKVMSRVWIEMLTYAAGHIKGEAHVRVLSKGGELLAFAWLLMAHFGCLYKPEWSTYEEFIFGVQLKENSDDDNGDQEEDDESTVVTELF